MFSQKATAPRKLSCATLITKATRPLDFQGLWEEAKYQINNSTHIFERKLSLGQIMEICRSMLPMPHNPMHCPLVTCVSFIICLLFLHCVFSDESSNHLQSHTSCICLTFLHCWVWSDLARLPYIAGAQLYWHDDDARDHLVRLPPVYPPLCCLLLSFRPPTLMHCTVISLAAVAS